MNEKIKVFFKGFRGFECVIGTLTIATGTIVGILFLAGLSIPSIPPGGIEKMEAHLRQLSENQVGKDHPAPGDNILNVAALRGCPLDRGAASIDCQWKNMRTMQATCDRRQEAHQEARSAAQNAKVTP